LIINNNLTRSKDSFGQIVGNYLTINNN